MQKHRQAYTRTKTDTDNVEAFADESSMLCSLGRDDFRFFWNFITAFQILPCVIETRRYGYIRDSGSRVETPHGPTIGCEKSYNG